jgi:hypothetical protein
MSVSQQKTSAQHIVCFALGAALLVASGAAGQVILALTFEVVEAAKHYDEMKEIQRATKQGTRQVLQVNKFGHCSTDTTKEFIKHDTRNQIGTVSVDDQQCSILWRRSPFSHQLAPRQVYHVVPEHALHWSYSEGKQPQSYGLSPSALQWEKLYAPPGRKLDCFEKTRI